MIHGSSTWFARNINLCKKTGVPHGLPKTTLPNHQTWRVLLHASGPKSLKAQFQSPRFVRCLHTKSEIKAAALSTELSSRLENIWDRMRLDLLDFKAPVPRTTVLGSSNRTEEGDFLIADGFKLYLRLKAGSKTSAFITYTKRNQRYLTECLGDAKI